MRDLVSLQMNKGLSNGDVFCIVLRSTDMLVKNSE